MDGEFLKPADTTTTAYMQVVPTPTSTSRRSQRSTVRRQSSKRKQPQEEAKPRRIGHVHVETVKERAQTFLDGYDVVVVPLGGEWGAHCCLSVYVTLSPIGVALETLNITLSIVLVVISVVEVSRRHWSFGIRCLLLIKHIMIVIQARRCECDCELQLVRAPMYGDLRDRLFAPPVCGRRAAQVSRESHGDHRHPHDSAHDRHSTYLLGVLGVHGVHGVLRGGHDERAVAVARTLVYN
jgi:hypothetical protein